MLASWVVTGFGIAHMVVAGLVFRAWTANPAWFVGAGLGVVFVGTLNLVQIGLGPCRMPTVRFVRAATLVSAIFGAAVLIAVPEPQAFVLVAALVAQVVAGRVALPGPD